MMTFKLIQQNQLWLFITRERTPYITRQKDTLQRRSMVLMSFC